MKAAIVEAAGQLSVREIVEPQIGPYQARCQLLFGSTCAGTDSHIIDGSFPFIGPLPTILGHESIGRVVELGPKVRNLKVGDLVTRVGTLPSDGYSITWGGFCEQGVAVDHRAMAEDGLPENQWKRHRIHQTLPSDVDPAAATMFITWRETLSYLQRMGQVAGKRVLVIGSGGNGLSFVSHARNLGAAAVAMVGSPNRAGRAERAGASSFVDYKRDDVKDHAAAAAPEGFDFVIDAVGKAGLANLGLSLLTPGGTIGVYGLDEPDKLQLNPRMARGNFTWKSNAYDEPETHDQVLGLYQAGRLDASVWLELDEAYELEDINAAFDAVRSRERVKSLVRLSRSA